MMENLKSAIEMFYHWENTTPNNTFLRQPSGNKWDAYTYQEAGQQARKVASYLKKIGIKKGDHICLLSKNCYHWVIADLSIMMVGAVSVPLYASLPKDQLKVVVEKSDCKAIFVGKLDKWGDKIDAIPADVDIVRFDHYNGNAEVAQGKLWADILVDETPLQKNFIPNIDDLWTIKFTSGTTGHPKGVMLPHKNPSLVMQNEEKTNWIGIYKMQDHRFFSFLPLNHVAERFGVEIPCLYVGGTMSFAESLDTFAQNIQQTQPTMLFAVPRIWTKFYLGVTAKMPEKKLNLLLKIPVVSGIIKKKLRTALGLRDIQIAATGAAITPKFLKEWYQKLGIHLVEAYGMTEVSGSMTNGPDMRTPSDSVGRAIPFGEVKIHPETDEILMKTPYIMTGYYKDPEKTAEVLIDGWMHSGDRGTIDENGYLRVIGRVKDAFKTSKGSYVVPNPIEERIATSNYIEQCCVAGLGIPQPICLVNLSEEGQNANKADVETSLIHVMQNANAQCAGFERVSTMIVNQETWTEHNNLLTPTLKVRRGKIDDKYSDQFLNWHEEDNKVIWA